MKSIAHEPTNVNHERGLRSLNHFLRGDSILRGNIAVVALGFPPRDKTSVAHISHSEENANPDFIFLVALGGHLRRAKPSDRGTKNAWENWEVNMSNVDFHPCETRGRQMDFLDNENLPPLSQCKHCPSLIKINLSSLTVGVCEHPRVASNERSVWHDQASARGRTTQLDEGEA